MGRIAWVVVDDHGGDLDVAGLPVADLVVAADSGYSLAERLGLDVDLLVGDLDSLSVDGQDRAEAAGVRVERHPAAKDATDLALALAAAVDGTDDGDLLVVVGGSGGRLDHALANLLALGDPALAGRRVVARIGPADVVVVRGEAALELPVGDTVTLLPVGGDALGVSTTGLAYPLHDEDLPAGTTRGVSNLVAEPAQGITVRSGVLLAVHPPSEHLP